MAQDEKISVVEVFDAPRVAAALRGTAFEDGLRHFTTIGSTNSALIEAAAAGAPTGTVYFADEQTAGRGRGGHTWHSAPGDGLYVSALVRPRLPLRAALRLSLATGLAACAAIRETTGLAPDIRWPNDLLLPFPGSAAKKVGGILVETAAAGDGVLRYAVVGVGINVNQHVFPSELMDVATSLRLAGGTRPGRTALLVALLRALDRELRLLESGAGDLLPRFAAASSWVCGKRVSVPDRGGYTGVTDGLDVDGYLQVRAEDGTRRTVLTGGVREA